MYYILFERAIQTAFANRVISIGDGIMGLRVVTGVLEAARSGIHAFARPSRR